METPKPSKKISKKSEGLKRDQRPALSKNTETDVLVRSRRRCCLCAFLNNDFSVKQFQIAHIDRNPANNQPDNLVSLCLEHHDDYDSRRSQSKGMTANEIKHWRSELDKVWQKRDEQLSIRINGSGGPEGSSTKKLIRPSARLLGEVLNALDDDMLRWQENGNWTGQPTGIKLSRLGQRAILEEGDLDVALEAFMSLLRLSVAAPDMSTGSMQIHQRMPLLTPSLSTVNLLQTMQQDYRLIVEAARSAQIYALIGDRPASDLADYSKIPHESWQTVVDILYHYVKFGRSEEDKKICGGYLMICLPDLLVGLGIVLLSQGFDLPATPHEIRITMSDERGIEPGQPDESKPYVYLANKIAMLPEGDFQFALKRLNHYRHPMSRVLVDLENHRYFSLKDALAEIRGRSILPKFEDTFVAVDNEDAREQCLNLIQESQKLGQAVVNSTKAFLIAERECAVHQCYFREGTNAPYSHEVNMESDVISFNPSR